MCDVAVIVEVEKKKEYRGKNLADNDSITTITGLLHGLETVEASRSFIIIIIFFVTIVLVLALLLWW